MTSLVAAMVEGRLQTVPFHKLPATTRPINALWFAHTHALLQLRLPLYHTRLRKPRPKQKVYDEALQAGLAVLASFAREVGTHRAIVRIDKGTLDAISFQPRPFAANWNRSPSLSPDALADPTTDPLTLTGQLPTVSTGDMLHLAGKVALVMADIAAAEDHPDYPPSGTVTIEFPPNAEKPAAHLVYRHLNLAHAFRARFLELKQ
jgi:hypothetical protein